MEQVSKILEKTKKWYRELPEKKKYVEFITAVLSVPVMLTVIIINLNNLNQQKNANQKQTDTTKATPIQVVITSAIQPDSSHNSIKDNSLNATAEPLTPTASSCIKEVGPVSIVSPRESEVVTDNPVCVTIATQSNYCKVTWSYRLGDGNWSDYSAQNICFYNLTNGIKTVQVKFKSTASDDSATLQRSFVYSGNNAPTATPIVASSSAGL